MNKKLLIYELITVGVTVPLFTFIGNTLTNDENFKGWLLENGIGIRSLIVSAVIIVIISCALVYFKFRNQATDELNKVSQNQRSGDNSQNYQAAGNISIVQQNAPITQDASKIDVTLEPFIEPVTNPQATLFWARLKVTNNSKTKNVNISPQIQLESELESHPLEYKHGLSDFSLNGQETKVLNVANFRGGQGQIVTGKENIELCFLPENKAKANLSRQKKHKFSIVFRSWNLPPYFEKFVLFIDENGELQFKKFNEPSFILETQETALQEGLPKECIEILKLYIQKRKSFFYKEDIESLLDNINTHKIQYYLDILVERRLISDSSGRFGFIVYELNKNGRKWLVENNLL